ncbi:hypothetical protein BDV97DRAFT_363470 [Delphinella strobiligena]|nr:hypothetical protein BDV97DRAFT_363470 [Delphinella strobiligena]
MSVNVPNAAETSPRGTIPPRALAEIRYNSITQWDNGASSEEDTPETREIAPRDVQDLVGVSLGRAQTRLNSPQTTGVEKEAAIEDGGGFVEGPPVPVDADLDEDSDSQELGKSEDGANDTRGEDRVTRHTRSKTDASTGRLPSPWRAGPKQHWKGHESRSGKRDAVRRRATLGPGQKLDGWREALMSSIPSLPKHFTFSLPFSGNHDDHKNVDTTDSGPGKPKRSGSLFASWTSSSTSLSRSSDRNSQERLSNLDDSPRTTPPTQTQNVERPMTRQLSRVHSEHGLRRSTSDTSLQTFRSGGTLSRVPSLGDDSRFEHVQEQVNSRMKAIRDSWQDTNLKLPTLSNLPMPSLTHLSLGTGNDKRTSLSSRGSTATTQRPRTVSESPAGLPILAQSEVKQNAQSARGPTNGGFTGKGAQAHPHFTKALANLTGDVVILGGYRGSILRSADPPHRQLWAPIKVGLNVRKVDLEVGLNPEDDERAEQKVISSGMLTHIGPVDISRRLFKRLRACENAKSGELRVHDYGYDWRLEPAFLSRRLIKFLESLPCNQAGTPKEKRGAIVLAHSLGGLITRHAVNQRPELFAGVVYAGVPSTCVNILGPFRNGDDVLLSSRVLTAQVNFSIRTSFALLPLNGRCFFNRDTKEEYPVDFFDPQHWIEYRWSPCIARPLPPLSHGQPTGLAGIMSSMANALPTRKGSIPTRTKQVAQHAGEQAAGGMAKAGGMEIAAGDGNSAMARGNIDKHGTDNLPSSKSIDTPSTNAETAAQDQSTSIATAVTISREDALKYLTRVLASVKNFKQELAHNPAHQEADVYPPVAVIYGKTTPTVYGAHVVSREAIKHADAYDNLAFASGDGVVLARAAMLPEGYPAAKGGIVSSDRGHVTLLGDLEAVGKCLRSIQLERKKEVGKEWEMEL